MKLTLRLLLGLCLVMAAVYAATPLWLPVVIGKQLPDEWQLRHIKTGYPGVSGINIHSLRLNGRLPEAELDISATDIHFSYRQFQSDIGSMSMDVYLPEAPEESAGITNLDDLSIPLINLPVSYQELSVGDLELTIHQFGDSNSDSLHKATFKRLTLAPHPDAGFYFTSEFNYLGLPLGPGWLEVDLSVDSLKADLQFPVDEDVQKWLTISARQRGLQTENTTEVRVEIDTDSIGGDWLDSMLSQNSGGRLSHVSGRLDFDASFSGTDAQPIQQLSLDADNLQFMIDGESLDLSSRINTTRDDNNIIIELTTPTRFQAPDSSGKLDQLLQTQFPEIQRTAHSVTNGTLVINAGSLITLAAGDVLAIHFQGGIGLDLQNDIGSFALISDHFSASMTEFPKLEDVAIEGSFQVDWKEQARVSYKTQAMNFSVDALSVSAEVVSTDGLFISHGNGEFVKAQFADPETTFKRIDMQWQDMDIRTSTGNLAIQTQGIKSINNGKTWSGFDLSADSNLTNGNLIKGSGKLLIKQGPILPMQFSGAIDDNRWDISIPTTTIKPGQLGGLLEVVQLDLPAYLTVSNGNFDLAAQVSVADEVMTTLVVNGQDMDVSVHKSLADNMAFAFTSQVGDSISGSGPITIETISLASGLDITGFESNMTMESSDSFTLRDLKANLFEGSLNLDKLRYTGNGLEAVTAKLSRIDLAKLLVFADLDGLTGSGLLDITLPVSQKPAGLAITDGTFQSTAPGFLAYNSGSMSAGNIGLQALENFQYKRLAGTINYQPDGTYLVTVQLEGANPDLYDGYPVKFNLNINGALPALFESLFVSGDFEEAILKEIKNR